MTKQEHRNQAVMLADNFPGKAFLLITHLSETDPQVSSFSSDGTTFEIYDQSTFAHKYLPQYFKHSNYGSFVRQLNLYGFTSSRLEKNSQVIIWSHDSFRRDRKDLVKDIKRTKATKRTKTPHVQVSTRSPSPPSVTQDRNLVRQSSLPGIQGTYLEVSAGGSGSYAGCPSLSSGDGVSSNGHTHSQSSYKISGKGLGFDHTWLESEFAYLKQQNRSLEQKLDMLMKITLQVSPVSYEAVQSGEKRRRMSPLQSRDPLIPVQTSIHIHHNGLGSIHEEQKPFYGDDCSVDPAPYGENTKIPQTLYGRNMQISHTTYAVDENIPVEVKRSIPHVAAEEAGRHDFGTIADSLKGFVDIMLTKDEQEECKEVDGHEMLNSRSTSPHAARAPTNMSSMENGYSTPSLPGTSSQGSLDYEQLEEAMRAMASIDTNGDLFTSSNYPEDYSPRIPDQSEAHPPHPTNLVTRTDATVDKVDGPQPIQSTSFDIPGVQSGNIEECNMPVGMVVISAEAELVEDSRDGIANSSNENLHQIEQYRQMLERSRRKKLLCLLIFMIANFVLAVGVTWPIIAFNKNYQKEIPKQPDNVDEDPSQNTKQVLRSSNNVRDHIWSRVRSRSRSKSRGRGRSRSRGKRIGTLFDHARKDNSPKIYSLSVKLEGIEFVCSRGETV